MLLEDLSTGHRTSIHEDRGAGASGCRLDESALAEAAARIEDNLEDSPDLLVLNKFGKAECDGGGLLDLIASAMDRNIRVVILSAEGYGIHGTPTPEKVSKAESHGCLGLTNWDAERVASEVSKGTPVDSFVKYPRN